jgi:predicted  nucleic acid-binding Zn-ribbon protein
MICAEFDQIYGTDKENLKAEMREAQSALVRAEASASDLRRQLEKSQKELHDLKIVVERGSEEVLFYKKRNKEILDSSKALEQVVANLNQQLEGARNDNGALLLELKLYQSRFSDRTEMFEEIKRENERNLLKKEQEIKERSVCLLGL